MYNFDRTINIYNLEETKTANKPNSVCWWCCHSFEGNCIPIPVYYKSPFFKVYGCFCSYNCCKAFILYEKPLYASSQSLSLLNYMYKLNTGKFEDIQTAPTKYILKMFGGSLDIDQFRSGFFYNISTVKYPMVALKTSFEHQLISEKINSVNNSYGKNHFVSNKNKTISLNQETPSLNSDTEPPKKKTGLSALGIKKIKKK